MFSVISKTCTRTLTYTPHTAHTEYVKRNLTVNYDYRCWQAPNRIECDKKTWCKLANFQRFCFKCSEFNQESHKKAWKVEFIIQLLLWVFKVERKKNFLIRTSKWLISCIELALKYICKTYTYSSFMSKGFRQPLVNAYGGYIVAAQRSVSPEQWESHIWHHPFFVAFAQNQHECAKVHIISMNEWLFAVTGPNQTKKKFGNTGELMLDCS